VIRALTDEGIVCSVDTSRAVVASAALAAGAAIINDVSGGVADPDMVHLAAEAAVPWILMHYRGPSDVMATLAHYTDTAVEVRDELMCRVEIALAAGVFAKEAHHNWEVLRRLDLLVDTGFPVLIGASRKRFLGSLLAAADGTPRPPAGREVATAAISVIAGQQGVWGVRVHDVASSVDALAVHAALTSRRGANTGPLQPAEVAAHV